MSSHIWRDYFENVLVAVFLALFVRTFVMTGYKVPTITMLPTLKPGDFIFAYRLPYGVKVPLISEKLFLNSPEKSDVIVFTYAEQPRVRYAKRVIGLSGDRIEIKAGELIINGVKSTYQPLESDLSKDLADSEFLETFLESNQGFSQKIVLKKQAMQQDFGPLIVPPGEVFVLGDYRDASDDSRYWGTVPISRVEGRVMFIWLSLLWQNSQEMPQIRWDRTFSVVR